jgi:site-specific DNA recombinase
MYELMNEAERREFLTQIIEKIEIYEEEQENGQWLKSIEFKLPIIEHDMEISLDNSSQIEMVVLITRK